MSTLSIFLFIFNIFLILYNYKKYSNAVFLDSNTYFIIFSNVYMLFPVIMISISENVYLPTYINKIYYRDISVYIIYFSMILSSYYLFKSNVFYFKVINLISHKVKFYKFDIKIILLFLVILNLYVMCVFIYEIESLSKIMYFWDDHRIDGSDFQMLLNAKYKITFTFGIVATLVFYLIFIYKDIRFTCFFAPYILLSLAAADRTYIFQCFTLIFFAYNIIGKKINFLIVSIIAYLIILIEVLRVKSPEGGMILDFYAFIPGEILGTFGSSFVVYGSNLSIDFFDHIFYSILNAFAPILTKYYYASPINFNVIIDWESPVAGGGIGGSLLSEVFSYKNELALLVYPFIVILILKIVNISLLYGGFIGRILFVFYLFCLLFIFRGGIVYSFSLIIYYTFYTTLWYWFALIKFKLIKI